ncbi:hypothetical protein [Paenibacillus bovis]|uniref:Uncharacterized protein n=1 Tax=Paenibacillus bovis TaxID=1616788 RepID=A0A172ZJQ3_9BACL|nr:hypothetical protein [Paenibacillus bovis]ANF97875.1 hypothetical protein AR543_18875 [Paenibacillus bovis]
MSAYSLQLLLQGKILLKELVPVDAHSITWMEIGLPRDCLPAYPLRIEPGAMIGFSPYRSSVPIEKARFQVRISSFNRADIEQELKPSYDRVGEYRQFASWQEIQEYLSHYDLDIDDFTDSAHVDKYPL